jgi:hypothetical protein
MSVKKLCYSLAPETFNEKGDKKTFASILKTENL